MFNRDPRVGDRHGPGVPRSKRGKDLAAAGAEKTYEKYAWIILLPLEVFGVALPLGGRPSATEAAIGLYSQAALNVLGIAVTLKPYRNGKRGAWYFL